MAGWSYGIIISCLKLPSSSQLIRRLLMPKIPLIMTGFSSKRQLYLGSSSSFVDLVNSCNSTVPSVQQKKCRARLSVFGTLTWRNSSLISATNAIYPSQNLIKTFKRSWSTLGSDSKQRPTLIICHTIKNDFYVVWFLWVYYWMLRQLPPRRAFNTSFFVSLTAWPHRMWLLMTFQ